MLHIVRVILFKVDAMVAEMFPNESADSPGVAELASNSALFINHGSTFTGDGLRPTLPKVIQGAKERQLIFRYGEVI